MNSFLDVKIKPTLRGWLMNSGPIQRNETAGMKAWCACGFSENKPYCDGTHARSADNKRPVCIELKHRQTVVWCGCGKTSAAPFCDGSHAAE